jgi:hypothetical protein
VGGQLDPNLFHGPSALRRRSVVKDWLGALPFKQQSVVLIAVRGCDGLPKSDPSKALVRWYRRTVLNNADRPGSAGFGTFMLAEAPSLDGPDVGFLDSPDHYPVHWLMHFLHGVEIVGYKHPEDEVRSYWSEVYRRGVRALHLNVETMGELDARLAWGTEG